MNGPGVCIQWPLKGAEIESNVSGRFSQIGQCTKVDGQRRLLQLMGPQGSKWTVIRFKVKKSMVKMNGLVCSKDRPVLSFGTSSFFYLKSVLFDTRPFMSRPLSMDRTMQFNLNDRPIRCMTVFFGI